jgi:hypothetical protein
VTPQQISAIHFQTPEQPKDTLKLQCSLNVDAIKILQGGGELCLYTKIYYFILRLGCAAISVICIKEGLKPKTVKFVPVLN